MKDGPAFAGAAFYEGGCGIDGKRAARNGQHGGVVDGVAEDRVWVHNAGVTKGCDFALIGGNIEDPVGNAAVVYGYAGGEDAVGGDVEAADAFFNDPIVCGADGPDVGAALLELGDEVVEFGEDVGFDVIAEEGGGCDTESAFLEAGVNLDHLAADG